MATSTLSSIPHDLEPLPRYTRDPETSSIHSTAPSYVSEAPSYHSTHPEAQRPTNSSTSDPSSPNPSSTTTANTTLSHHHTHHAAHHPAQPPSHHSLHTSRTPTGARTPTPTSHHHPTHHQTLTTDIHSLAARLLRPAPPQRYTFPDSAGFVNEAKARKMYMRELREEAALREKGIMWGHVTGQIRGQRERARIWEGKTGR